MSTTSSIQIKAAGNSYSATQSHDGYPAFALDVLAEWLVAGEIGFAALKVIYESRYTPEVLDRSNVNLSLNSHSLADWCYEVDVEAKTLNILCNSDLDAIGALTDPLKYVEAHMQEQFKASESEWISASMSLIRQCGYAINKVEQIVDHAPSFN